MKTNIIPVQVNGKKYAEINIPLDAEQDTIEAAVLSNATILERLDGRTPRKIISVRNRIVNVVV